MRGFVGNVPVRVFFVLVCYVCCFGRDEVINKSRKSDKCLVYRVKSFPTMFSFYHLFVTKRPTRFQCALSSSLARILVTRSCDPGFSGSNQIETSGRNQKVSHQYLQRLLSLSSNSSLSLGMFRNRKRTI